MKNKVLKVDMVNGTATVGNEETQTMEEYSLDDFNYTPNVGDYVQVFKNNSKTMIILEGSQYQSEETPANTIPVSGPNGQTVNKVVYGLLAIFLGNWGIHHFYAGDTSRGLKYLLLSLLLCWTVVVPLVIEIKSIIQGVQVLSMPADGNGNVFLYHN